MDDPGSGPRQFEDRREAGRALAEALRERAVEADVVLAIPRGGLPLGRAVADALSLPLDVVVTSKIGAPDNPEFAIGAVGSDGSVWLDEDLLDRLGIDRGYVKRERQRETEAAREKARSYREGEPPDLEGKRVLVVDDGLATGSTMIAAVRLVRAQGADSVVVAVPVGPPDTVEQLREIADEVICLETPLSFRAVGQFYRRFDQVSDAEAIALLHGAGSDSA